jgi:hypothetical protein
MIGMKTKTKFNHKKLLTKARQGNITSLGHAAAAIRLTARRSILKRKNPSLPGQPPHTQTRRIKDAILYDVDKTRQSAIIGPSRDIIGMAGRAHEMGGRYYGRRYPPRPYMQPALEKLKDRLAMFWAGSIH